jgi:hypothetical protein
VSTWPIEREVGGGLDVGAGDVQNVGDGIHDKTHDLPPDLNHHDNRER